MEIPALKQALRALAPAAVPVSPAGRPVALPTPFQGLDQLLAGGLPRGAITEIRGSVSSGKTALALSIASSRTAQQELVAYLDGRGEFYPPAAAALGVHLSHVLLVSFARSQKLEVDIARAAEIIIRSRQIPLIVIDLPRACSLSPRRCVRLRQSAHATGTTLIVVGEPTSSITAASVRMEVIPQHKRSLRRLEIRVDKGGRDPATTTEVSFYQHRIDHSPPSPVAEIVKRKPPGTPLTRPARCHNQRGVL